MSRFFFTLVFALSTASAQPRAPAPPGPDALMSALTTEVMATLREDKAAGRKTDLAQLVEARIVPVLAYRDSFAHAVRTGGIDGLIKALEERNKQNLSGTGDAAKLATVLMIYGGSTSKP